MFFNRTHFKTVLLVLTGNRKERIIGTVNQLNVVIERNADN